MIVLRSNNTTDQPIGRGGYWDKIAYEAIQRKNRIENGQIFVTECGLGASGFPHIGSFADASRAYAVTKAVADRGEYQAKFIAYSDDLDGLRKVPAGLPEDLQNWLGVPVTKIPDPFGCHQSYGHHMTSLLLDSLDTANIEYVYQSGAQLYADGAFKDTVKTILQNADTAGKIIFEETGQEKYLEEYPYHPICKNCGKIYTTTVVSVNLDKGTLIYRCHDVEMSGNILKGCEDQREISFDKDQGKLSWKVEFASRWKVLGVDFEPYGKDILDSVNVNNRISKEILNYEPPYQIRYEMFLDKSGEKISKSKGNVFTPQMWFTYGSPQSLILMTLKRFEGSRSLGIHDIPQYMDELDQLEANYRGLTKQSDEKQEQLNRSLFEYIWWLEVPSDQGVLQDDSGRYAHISYNLLSNLAKYTPPQHDIIAFVQEKLRDYDLVRSDQNWETIREKVKYAVRWLKDFQDTPKVEISLQPKEREALQQLVQRFEEIDLVGEEIQSIIFHTSKEFGIKPRDFFSLLYKILLREPNGPRMWKLIEMMGNQSVEQINNTLQNS